MSRRSFTFDEKLKICVRLRSGEKNSNLCKEFNVYSSTISTIYKNRDKWLKEETRLGHTRVKKIRGSNYKELDDAFLAWFR